MLGKLEIYVFLEIIVQSLGKNQFFYVTFSHKWRVVGIAQADWVSVVCKSGL